MRGGEEGDDDGVPVKGGVLPELPEPFELSPCTVSARSLFDPLATCGVMNSLTA